MILRAGITTQSLDGCQVHIITESYHLLYGRYRVTLVEVRTRKVRRRIQERSEGVVGFGACTCPVPTLYQPVLYRSGH